MTLFTWDTEGKRIQVESSYRPYVYLETTGESDALSIFNTKLRRKGFNSQFERSKFIKESGNKRVFENLGIYQQFLVDMFWQEYEKPEFSQNPLRVCFLDIEVYSPEDGFPHANQARAPINVITLYDSLDQMYYTWGMKAYTPKEKNVKYVHCSSEKQLLEKFLRHIEKDHPDIITGWNSKFFDIPYIINRIPQVCEEHDHLRLSPTKNIYSKVAFNKFGKEETVWIIDGISSIDYLDAYRKFCLSPRDSYKLDNIASIELGESKVDYGSGNLADLADENWETFIDYNIQDVRLLVRLEENLRYLELLRSLSITGLTTMEAALGSIQVITGAAAIRARNRKQKIPTFIRDEEKNGKYEGAFVKEPESGIHKHLVSFDANSLYPNTIITLNISPETKLGVIVDRDDEAVVLKDVNEKVHRLNHDTFKKLIEKESIAVSKANVLFTQKKKGLFPEIIDIYYKQRVEARKKLKDVKKKISEMEDGPEKNKLKNEAKLLDIKQMTQKIFLNSVYGAFGNKYFSLSDEDLARSITLTGQAIINQGSKILTKYVKDMIGKSPEREVIRYIDTDSLFFSFDEIIENKDLTFSEKNKVTKEMYAIIDATEEHLNTEIVKWGEDELNSKDCRFLFKREKICDVGMLLKKKHYILHILDDEGVKCDKFKYTGVDVVKSTMPKKVKPYVKKIAETMIMTMDHQKTNAAIVEAYEKFLELPIEEIATIMGVKNYEKYASQCSEMQTVKAMPSHVKCSYHHNQLLKLLGAEGKYDQIRSGDKIKMFYLKQPNRYGLKAIGFKNYYPDEFKGLFEVDYEKMFDKVIFSPVEKFFEAVNWVPQKPNHMTKINLLDYFAE